MGWTGWRRRLPGAGLAAHRSEQKEEKSQAFFLSPYLWVSAFSCHSFSQHIWAHSLLFFPLSPLNFSNLAPSCPGAAHPLISYPFSANSFHSSLSLPGTFFPLLRLCVCVFLTISPLLLLLFTRKELGKRLMPAPSTLCHPTREWVWNTDTSATFQGNGSTSKPMTAEKHEYMSAATHSSRTWSFWFTWIWQNKSISKESRSFLCLFLSRQSKEGWWTVRSNKEQSDQGGGGRKRYTDTSWYFLWWHYI